MKRPDHLLADASYDTCLDVPTKEKHDDPAVAVVLTSITNRPARKTLRYTRVGELTEDPFEAPYKFTYEPYMAGTLEDLSALVTDMSEQSHEVLVRGAVIHTAGKSISRRHRRKDPERSLLEAPRLWCMIDVDKQVEGYHGLPENWIERPEEAVRELIRKYLPEPFHGAGVVVQWSSKMTPERTSPKVHLFFIMSRPTWSAELEHWLHGRAIDKAVFTPSQFHYTAAPELFDHSGEHLPDPLGERRVMTFDGPPVEVPDHIARAERPTRTRKHSGSGAGRMSFKRLEELRDDGVTPIHDQIRDLALSYVSINYPNHSLEYFRAKVVEKLTFRPDRPQSEIENRIGDDLEKSFHEAVDIVRGEQDDAKSKLAKAAEQLSFSSSKARSLAELMGWK
jgi:hypothetical protein